MGAGAVFTLQRAAELFPGTGTDAEVKGQLRSAGLVHVVNGAELVCWEDVLEWVRSHGTPASAPKRLARSTARLPKPYAL